MSRIALAAAALLLLRPVPSHALFHFAVIDEVDAQAGGVAGQQYVEIRILQPLQNLVTNTKLSAFNCDGSFNSLLLQVPSNLGSTVTSGKRWIMATSVAAAGGITPDYTMAAGLPTGCGMVCWGAPVDPMNFQPKNPATWDQTDATQYTDCLAYGAYTGTPPAKVGTPNPDDPGAGTYSLTRGTSTNDNAADFAFACPSPTNFAGNLGTFGACTPPTTTTTVTPTTTSTTLAPALLSGTALHLTVKGTNDAKKKVSVLSKDAAITIGTNAGPDDPVQVGATLRIVSGSAAGAFDTTYPLPAANWKYVGKAGKNKGYRWIDKAGPITAVLLKSKIVKIAGKGAGLGDNLDNDPNPVGVVLAVGSRTSCMSFGGTTKFKANKSYVATSAPAPASCP